MPLSSITTGVAQCLDIGEGEFSGAVRSAPLWAAPRQLGFGVGIQRIDRPAHLLPWMPPP